jgi:hypothetical protein
MQWLIAALNSVEPFALKLALNDLFNAAGCVCLRTDGGAQCA